MRSDESRSESELARERDDARLCAADIGDQSCMRGTRRDPSQHVRRRVDRHRDDDHVCVAHSTERRVEWLGDEALAERRSQVMRIGVVRANGYAALGQVARQ